MQEQFARGSCALELEAAGRRRTAHSIRGSVFYVRSALVFKMVIIKVRRRLRQSRIREAVTTESCRLGIAQPQLPGQP